MSNNYITLKAIGGLGNRFRFVFSHHLYAKSIGKTLKVYWKKDNCCNGLFLDYFEPINGIEFFNEDFLHNESYNFSSYGWHENFSPLKYFLYDEVKPLPYLQDKINNEINKLGIYYAVHIRKTDFVVVQKKYNLPILTDQYFIDKLNNINHDNIQSIYLATDNAESQTLLSQAYPNKIKFYQKINSHAKNYSSKRLTSLEHAIIDIYICANSKQFIQTPFSSYSGLIRQIRAGYEQKISGYYKLKNEY